MRKPPPRGTEPESGSTEPTPVFSILPADPTRTDPTGDAATADHLRALARASGDLGPRAPEAADTDARLADELDVETVHDEDATTADVGAVAEEQDRAGGAPRGLRGLRPPWVKAAAAVAAAVLAGGAALAYRSHHRGQVIAEGMQRAREMIRLDTGPARREAAALLEPVARLDPVEAASLRAFALAMLALDQADEAAGAEAERLLVEPGRAREVPAYAPLAYAALALSRREAGTATTFLSRSEPAPPERRDVAPDAALWRDVIRARVALLAGNAAAAATPLESALARDGAFAPALALHGDVLRSSGRAEAAGAAYRAALDVSPQHPRAREGLARLEREAEAARAAAAARAAHAAATEKAAKAAKTAKATPKRTAVRSTRPARRAAAKAAPATTVKKTAAKASAAKKTAAKKPPRTASAKRAVSRTSQR